MGLNSSTLLLQAGTGKTMMTQIIKEMLNSDPELVGELENNASEQYGLAKLAGRFVIICNDVDSNWTLDATQFTKMVSGTLYVPLHGNCILPCSHKIWVPLCPSRSPQSVLLHVALACNQTAMFLFHLQLHFNVILGQGTPCNT